ncbi:hypothetical protein [Alteromonas sp. H39]|uniref:hypothetical protein n=1 Tax=Alteromonas sp. H39 TaxID=3389876 RepID=UPI0039E02DF1
MTIKTLWMLLAIGLVGCKTLPTPTDVDNADYGAYPADYEAIVKSYYRSKLSDPDSARYQLIATPQRYWLGNELDDVYYGYLVCVTLNTKNLFGGYKGYQTDGLLIRNGDVIKHVEEGSWWGKEICTAPAT